MQYSKKMFPSACLFLLVLPASSLKLALPSKVWLAAGHLCVVAAKCCSHTAPESLSCRKVLQWTLKLKLPICRRMGDRGFRRRCGIVSDATSLLCAGSGARGDPNQTERAGQNITYGLRAICACCFVLTPQIFQRISQQIIE